MPGQVRLPRRVLGLILIALAPLSAYGDDKASGKPKKDYPGTTVIMGQFRELFAVWDLNKDGFLDKAELAKAFRGANAKPYDPKSKTPTTTKADLAKYPDYQFLVHLDQNGDGKISQEEFADWARSYAQELKKLRSTRSRVAQKQQKLKQQPPGADRKKLLTELHAEQKALAEQKKQMHQLDVIEKHLQHVKRK